MHLKTVLEYIVKGILLGSNDDIDNKFKDAISGRGTISKLYKLLFPSSIAETKLLEKGLGYKSPQRTMGFNNATINLFIKVFGMK